MTTGRISPPRTSTPAHHHLLCCQLLRRLLPALLRSTGYLRQIFRHINASSRRSWCHNYIERPGLRAVTRGAFAPSTSHSYPHLPVRTDCLSALPWRMRGNPCVLSSNQALTLLSSEDVALHECTRPHAPAAHRQLPSLQTAFAACASSPPQTIIPCHCTPVSVYLHTVGDCAMSCRA